MTEVKCFQHSKNRTKKNINYLRIQRFKRLIHWFHFDPVRDLSHLLTVKTFLLHSAAEFLCEGKSSIFWRRQKSCSIHHRQIRLRTPKERAVFSDCMLGEDLKPTKFVTSTKQNTLPPLPPNRFFCHPDSGWSCDQPRNQGLSSNDQGRQRRETLGTRLLVHLHTVVQRLHCPSRCFNIVKKSWKRLVSLPFVLKYYNNFHQRSPKGY